MPYLSKSLAHNSTSALWDRFFTFYTFFPSAKLVMQSFLQLKRSHTKQTIYSNDHVTLSSAWTCLFLSILSSFAIVVYKSAAICNAISAHAQNFVSVRVTVRSLWTGYISRDCLRSRKSHFASTHKHQWQQNRPYLSHFYIHKDVRPLILMLRKRSLQWQ